MLTPCAFENPHELVSLAANWCGSPSDMTSRPFSLKGARGRERERERDKRGRGEVGQFFNATSFGRRVKSILQKHKHSCPTINLQEQRSAKLSTQPAKQN